MNLLFCYTDQASPCNNIIDNASSSTKKPMVNLPMYSIPIFVLEVEGQGRRRFGSKLTEEGTLSTSMCAENYVSIGPIVFSQQSRFG